MKQFRAPLIALLAATSIANASAAATVALDGLARFRFAVVEIAFATGGPGVPIFGTDYSLTASDLRLEDTPVTRGPASATVGVGGFVSEEFNGEGAVTFAARGESPGGTVDFASGSYLATLRLQQLGERPIALTLEYALDAAITARIDNPGAAIDPAAGFVSVLSRISAIGFDVEESPFGVFSENAELGFNNFSDLEPIERVDIARLIEGETRRLRLVNQPGRVGGSVLSLSAFAGGQLLLGDGAPAVTPPEPVAPIPLPAAGWMLLAGLGALAAVRKRRA